MNHLLAGDALAAFAADLRGRAGADRALEPFAELLEQVDCTAPRFAAARPFVHPAMDHLAPALASASGAADLLRSVRAVADAVNWYQIYDGAGVDQRLAQGMLAGQIAGMSGIVASDAMRAGLFLLAPGIHYPFHTHGAGEIYYCLSGTLTLQYGLEGAPFGLTPGTLSVTPPHRLHCLTTGDNPVLMLYCWIGAVDAPNWWWSLDPDGGWRRACWERQPDGSWARAREERVSAAVMAEANGQDGAASTTTGRR